MEALIADGYLAGVLDITTTELADELVGGVLSAGPDRLEAAGALGIPQVVSLGALDMVNFGPMDTVPEKFRDRTLYVHNSTITLMRTTPEECAELGRQIGEKLNAANGAGGPVHSTRGVSAIAVRGGVFDDPVADAALVDALLATVGDAGGSPATCRTTSTIRGLPRRWRAASPRLSAQRHNRERHCVVNTERRTQILERLRAQVAAGRADCRGRGGHGPLRQDAKKPAAST